MSEEDTSAPWLITVAEAARLLSLSPAHVYRMIARGEIPHVRFSGEMGEEERSPIRINPIVLREWLQHLEESHMPTQVSEQTIDRLFGKHLNHQRQS